MKRAAWAFFALLILGPCVQADTFDATSGYFAPIGGTGGPNIYLAGDGFTASGGVQIAPFGCKSDFLPGQPITGCETYWVSGLVTITTNNGEVIPIYFGYNFMMTFSQADMSLSGATEATLSEPAAFGLVGCINPFFPPDCPLETFDVTGDVTLTMMLTQDPFSGGYHVTSEIYTVTDPSVAAPEPAVSLMMLIGFSGLLFLRRRSAIRV